MTKLLIARNSPDYRPNDEYFTPEWLFTSMKIKFDLDVASPEGGISWIPANSFFTKDEDGLIQTWYGNVWMNPPYSQSKKWVSKFIEHRKGIALLPLAKSKWMTDLWNTCDGILPMLNGFKFIRDGEPTGSIFLPVALFAFGQDNVDGLKRLNIGRVR
jgi:hypothetical protein